MVNTKKFFGVICLLGIFQGMAATDEYLPDSYDSDDDDYWRPRPYKFWQPAVGSAATSTLGV